MIRLELGHGRFTVREGDRDPEREAVGDRIGDQLDRLFFRDANRGLRAGGRRKHLGSEVVVEIADLDRADLPHRRRRRAQGQLEIGAIRTAGKAHFGAGRPALRTHGIARAQRRRGKLGARAVEGQLGVPIRRRAGRNGGVGAAAQIDRARRRHDHEPERHDPSQRETAEIGPPFRRAGDERRLASGLGLDENAAECPGLSRSSSRIGIRCSKPSRLYGEVDAPATTPWRQFGFRPLRRSPEARTPRPGARSSVFARNGRRSRW